MTGIASFRAGAGSPRAFAGARPPFAAGAAVRPDGTRRIMHRNLHRTLGRAAAGRAQRRRLPGVAAVLSVLALLAGLGGAPAWADEIVVVVNDRFPATSLSVEQVRAIFLGERHYWDGLRAFPVTYPDEAPIMRDFLSRVLGMNLNQYKSYWIKRIFREGDVPPSRAATGAEVLRVVASHAGGIGFVEARDLGAAAGVHPVFRFPG